jgi:beta-lactamase regulating signal transducer with metallopeptidase domain
VSARSLSQAARFNGVVPWIGLAWFAGVVIGILRFAGGWGVARWIRQRATPVSAPAVLETAIQVSERWQLPRATLLTSDHVEAPVVVGHLYPAVILPRDAEQHLSPEAISPLLAHELAHIARQDYLTNLVQSLVDALLFFSPGARWISRCVRETREYCCDDLVVDHCGPALYVNALTTLAALAVVSRSRPAIGAAGPRLIVRIRRLLKEEVMTSFIGYRLTALSGILAIVALSGTGIVRLSGAGVASAAARSQDPAGVSSNYAVPIAYPTQQPGAAVTLRSVVASPEGLCGTADVYNAADIAVISLRFVAIVSSPGTGTPISIATSNWLRVDVPAFGEARVEVGLMPASDVYTLMKGVRSQVMCALQEIRFANNSLWSMTPNPAASTAEDALGFSRDEVSRALIGAASTSTDPNSCLDDNGGRYSEGAVVSVRLEPGRFARCSGGRWFDYVAKPVAAKPFVELELQLADGPRPRLKVEPGQMATIRRGTSNWGLLTTVDAADPSAIHVVVYDLSSQPRQQVADVFTRVGGPSVPSETNPPFTIRVVASSGTK